MEVKEVVKIAIGYVARANASTVANIRSFGEGTFQRTLSGLEQQV